MTILEQTDVADIGLLVVIKSRPGCYWLLCRATIRKVLVQGLWCTFIVLLKDNKFHV